MDYRGTISKIYISLMHTRLYLAYSGSKRARTKKMNHLCPNLSLTCLEHFYFEILSGLRPRTCSGRIPVKHYNLVIFYSHLISLHFLQFIEPMRICKYMYMYMHKEIFLYVYMLSCF